MGVPETVMAGSPGTRVEEPIMYWPCAFAVMVWLPNVRGGGVVMARFCVLMPKTA